MLWTSCGFAPSPANRTRRFCHAVAIACVLLCAALPAWSAPPRLPTTTTVLAVTSGGVAVTSVPSGSVVTLTATVTSVATYSGLVTPVTPGQVNFCDAATYCTGAHLLGTAQLTSLGIATYKFVPGPGTHSYKAVFVGTNSYAASPSLPVPLIVTGGAGVSAVGIQASGGQGDYDLLGTVSPAGTVSPTGQVFFLDTTNANYQLGAATLIPTGASNPSFRQSYSYQFPLGAGLEPGHVATGDFNNDGHPDILFASTELAAVYTLLGNGDGTFTTLSFPFPAVQSVEAPVVADFNSDGKLDFVLRTKTGLAVFLGNGDGTFTAGPTFSVAPLPTFAVADMNNDGIPDLLVGQGAALYTYLGNGSGGFAAPKLAFQGIIAGLGALTGDFNGDGDTDVLFISVFGSLQVLLGNGDGTLRSGPPISAQIEDDVRQGTVGDLNNDGITDLVIPIDFATHPPIVELGNGDGTFTILPRDAHLASASNSVALADFNGDGILDAVFPYLYGGDTNVYIGKGDGTFTPDIYSPGLAYFISQSLATADFNGDGQADIAEVFQGDYDQLVVLLSQSASTSAGYANGISPVGTGYHYVEAFYPGDANNPAGYSQTIALLAEQVTTNLTLTALPGSSPLGQNVTLTATLDQFFAQNHYASGDVTFTSNGNPIGTGTVTNGVATLTTSALPFGTDSLQASYPGDTNFTSSDSNVVPFTISAAQTGLTLNSSANPTTAGTPITLTAQLAFYNQSAAANQSVTLTYNPTGTAQVVVPLVTDANGTATYALPGGLAMGSYQFTATFAGIASQSAATASLTEVVNAAPDFTLTGPSPITFLTTTSDATPLTLASVGGFTANVALSCNASIPQYVCSMGPTSVPLSANGSDVVTLNLRWVGLTQAELGPGPRAILAALLPGSWLGLIGLRRRRRLRRLFGLLCLAVMASTISACTSADYPTIFGSYPVTVTATGTNASASTPTTHTLNMTAQIVR